MTNFTYTQETPSFNPTFVRIPTSSEKLLSAKVFTNSLQFDVRKDTKGLIAKSLKSYPFELDNYVGLYNLDISE